MTITVKTYKTERGARAYMKRLHARWPHKMFQLACSVGMDFRDRWYVEVFIDDVRGHPAWVAVGPMSREA